MTEMHEIVHDTEEYLRRVAHEVTAPYPDECVLCFAARMLDDHGCDHSLRWVRRFRDLRSPRATALERRMEDVGGSCDCEVFLNGFRPARHVLVRDLHTDELEAPEPFPPCAGVRLTDSRPCTHWERGR